MKVTLNEHGLCFEIFLEAESLEDSAKLVRMGINKTKTIRGIYVAAYETGAVSGSVVIGKKKDSSSVVK